MVQQKCKVAFMERDDYLGITFWRHEPDDFADSHYWGPWAGHAEYDIEESVEVYANQDGTTYVFPQTVTLAPL